MIYLIYFSQNSSLSYWLELGAPAELLLMGFPTYGRTFRLSSASSGLGAPASGAADLGLYTGTAGFWAYYEVKQMSILPYRVNTPICYGGKRKV